MDENKEICTDAKQLVITVTKATNGYVVRVSSDSEPLKTDVYVAESWYTTQNIMAGFKGMLESEEKQHDEI